MNDKYIIKNCPASSKDFRLNCQGKAYIDKYKCVYGLLDCQDCTDCLLKQIVEKCMEDWEDMTTDRFQRELLDLLDIQEVE